MPRLICMCITIAFVIIFAMPKVYATQCSVICGGANELQAKENCRKQAVQKVLVNTLSPNSNSFMQILNQYESFIVDVKVTNKKKQNSEIYLTAQVEVDNNKIEDAVKNLVNNNVSSDKVACFLIRVKGFEDGTKIGKCQQRIREVCGDRFQRLGFKTMVADELNPELNKLNAADYDTFCNAMLAKIKQDYPEITVAIIGEVNITQLGQKGTDHFREGFIKVKFVEFLSGLKITDFSESHSRQHADGDNIDIAFVEKCAVNLSESLISKIIK